MNINDKVEVHLQVRDKCIIAYSSWPPWHVHSRMAGGVIKLKGSLIGCCYPAKCALRLVVNVEKENSVARGLFLSQFVGHGKCCVFGSKCHNRS